MNDFRNFVTDALMSTSEVTITTQPQETCATYALAPLPNHASPQPRHPVALSKNHSEKTLAPEPDSPLAAETTRHGHNTAHTTSGVPGDVMTVMKQQTAHNNAISGNLESQQRLKRHLQEAYDQQALNGLLAQLSALPLLPLREAVGCEALPPLGHLPPEAADLVRQLAGDDLGRRQVACACLFGLVFAAARGNWILMDPRGIAQPLTGYLIASAPSGWGKSTMLNAFRALIAEYEFELRRTVQRADKGLHFEAELLALREVEKSIRANIRKACRKGSTNLPDPALTAQLAEVLEHQRGLVTDDAIAPRLLFDRVTMAQLPYEMFDQGGVAAIFGDEGGILQLINPRTDDLFVKGATGETYSTSNRKERCVTIAHPCLTVLLLVQPSKLACLFDNAELIDHGVAARFLPVMTHIPPDGATKPGASPDLTWLRGKARRLLDKSHRVSDGFDTHPRHTLTFGAEALDLLDDLARRSRARNATDTSAGLRHFIDRLPWHARNLAGAIHLLQHEHPEEVAVNAATVEGGVAFAEFFLEHAKVAYDPASSAGVVFATKILRWMTRDRQSLFSERDAQRGVGHCTSAQIRAGLDELIRSNHVRRYLAPGRSAVYVVHP